jgi:tRNA threonylcarbamoyladenosine biosynthesis protein TsaE
MTSLQRWQTTTTSAEMTEQLAQKIGHNLQGGEVIELKSDLGGGKTTFVRGLARGFGSHDHVSSPTFTISLEYKAGTRTLYHFDFYRLREAGIVAAELAEVVGVKDTVVVVEWGDIVANVLPDNRMSITIAASSEHKRELTFDYPNSLQYLITSMTKS